jgi:hypothetical protein
MLFVIRIVSVIRHDVELYLLGDDLCSQQIRNLNSEQL